MQKAIEASPYEVLTEDIIELDKLAPSPFDPYDTEKIDKAIDVSQQKIVKYKSFFDKYDRTNFKEAMFSKNFYFIERFYNGLVESYDLEKEHLAWCQNVRDLMQQILTLASAGILQSDIKKRLPDANPQHITRICKRFDADGVIKREKKGSSYYITLP